jgi:hypothetical protein
VRIKGSYLSIIKLMCDKSIVNNKQMWKNVSPETTTGKCRKGSWVNDFQTRTLLVQEIRARIDKWNFIKLKSLWITVNNY